MEEMSDLHRQLRLLKYQGNASEQKLMLLEKSVFELSNQKSGVKLMRVSSRRCCLLVLIGFVFLFLHGEYISLCFYLIYQYSAW